MNLEKFLHNPQINLFAEHSQTLTQRGPLCVYHQGFFPKIPWQFCASNIHALCAFLAEFSCANKIVIWTDSTPKQTIDNQNFLEFFYTLLHNAGIKSHAIQHLDIEALCHIQTQNGLHAEARHVELLAQILKDLSPQILCVLGSGTLCDLAKAALDHTQNHECLLIICPTALTVTAYSSAFTVLDYAGIKRTKKSRAAHGNIWIPDIVRGAPPLLNRCGFGDLLAFFTAPFEWELSYVLGLSTTWTPKVSELMAPYAPFLLQTHGHIFTQEKEWPFDNTQSHFLKLIEALNVAGVCMTLAGETAPLSGTEHAVSHTLDTIYNLAQKPLGLHGEQVALATPFALESLYEALNLLKNMDKKKLSNTYQDAKLIEKRFEWAWQDFKNTLLSAQFLDDRSLPSAEHYTQFFHDYHAKCQQWNASLQELLKSPREDYQNIAERIKQQLITPENLYHTLLQTHLPTSPQGLTPPCDAQIWELAKRFAPFERMRFSAKDACFFLKGCT